LQNNIDINVLKDPSLIVQHFDRIYKSILQRIPFDYSFKEYFRYLISSKFKCCKTFNPEIQRKGRLYEEGMRRLRNEFDFMQLLKHVRKVSLMSQVVFFKYQRFFLPYFTKNVLSLDNIEAQSEKLERKKRE